MNDRDTEDCRPLLHDQRGIWLPRYLHLGLPRSAEAHLNSSRRQLQRFLTSKAGHYFILLLVSLDVSCIFADFVITIFTCEHHHAGKGWVKALDALGIISLVFSCLFTAELIASIWAFGFRYFTSKFHCLDALVILSSFTVDVLLRGIIEEVASLIIILRLWRVFKIIEELSMGASEQMEGLQEKIEGLESENRELRRKVTVLEQG